MARLEGQTPSDRRIIGIPVKGNPTAETPNLNYNKDDNQFEWNSAGGGGSINFSELIGQIAIGQIPDKLITGSKLADETITPSQLGINSVTTAKIILNAVTTAKIADGQITNPKIPTDTITLNKLDVALQTINNGSLLYADNNSRVVANGEAPSIGQVPIWNGQSWEPGDQTAESDLVLVDVENDFEGQSTTIQVSPKRTALTNNQTLITIGLTETGRVVKVLVFVYAVAGIQSGTLQGLEFELIVRNSAGILGTVPLIAANSIEGSTNGSGFFVLDDPVVGDDSFTVSTGTLPGGTLALVQDVHMRIVIVARDGSITTHRARMKKPIKKTGPKKKRISKKK